jgi:hypothetical protein
MKNSLQSLQDHGQSVWLDYLRRSLITSGELKRLIAQDGVRGVDADPVDVDRSADAALSRAAAPATGAPIQWQQPA